MYSDFGYTVGYWSGSDISTISHGIKYIILTAGTLTEIFRGSDGFLPDQTPTVSGYAAAIADALLNTTAPLGVVSVVERLGFSNDEHRLHWVKPAPVKPITLNTYTSYHPPYSGYIRSDSLFESSSYISSDYYECSAIPCNPYSIIKSNIPLVAAIDPKTDTTVFVSVNTDPYEGISGYGQIKIHPGLAYDNLGNIQVNRLSIGVDVGDGSSVSDSFPSFYNYNHNTDFKPGLACATNVSSYTFNCLIAWQDQGVPTGDILYRYFRVNAGLTDSSGYKFNTITFEGNARVLPVSSIDLFAGGVSVGVIANKFYIGWTHPDGDVRWTRLTTVGALHNWDTPSTLSNAEAMGPPTWLYSRDPYKEGGIVWTEIIP